MTFRKTNLLVHCICCCRDNGLDVLMQAPFIDHVLDDKSNILATICGVTIERVILAVVFIVL